MEKTKSIYNDDLVCSNCKNDNSIRYCHTEGVIVCQSCGFVTERRFVDLTAEFRVFVDGNNSGADPRRVGGQLDDGYTDGGLGVYVHRPERGRGNSSRTMSTGDRKYSQGCAKLKSWGLRMNLQGEIIDEAISIFKKVRQNPKLRGKHHETILAAILFIATKIKECQIRPDTIENITGQPKDEMKRCYNIIKRDIPEFTYTKPEKFVPGFCDKLGLTLITREAATKIAEKISTEGYIDGKNPRTVAGVSIFVAAYLSPNEKKTFKDISNYADIAENTIKQAYRDIHTNLKNIVHEWPNRSGIENLTLHING
jgi:transcription initiation factor TFIIB